ncbi:KR domain-containing protein [Trichoderma sp. SZMC 28015]
MALPFGLRRFSNMTTKAIQSTTIGSENIFSCPGILLLSWTAIDLFEEHYYQASCQSVDYAQLIRLSRTIRTEALSNSAVCGADDFETSLNGAMDVFAKRPLASLNWVSREQKHLKGEKIEIKLHAIDLNFKCRLGCPLRAVNDIPCPDEGVGTEDTGMIRRARPRVQTLRPDDPVMTVKASIFTAHAIILKKLCVQIPDNISFEDATAMTTVFSMVVESMFNVAHLEKDQAWAFAIQLAKMVKFLMDGFNIPRSRTYQHHDTRFVEGATRETNSRSVDVALNFLSTSWRWTLSLLVEHNARQLISFSRSAGDSPDDVYFVRELESLGCAVEIVKVSVVNTEDVAGAMQLATNLKDWNTATMPKVRYTWNLHKATRETGIKPDFFSSMRRTTGIAGQSNYASTNACLSSFVQYRTGLGLRASHVDQGAVQDAGHVNDETLVKRMNVANTNDVSECELLEAIGRVILRAHHGVSNESDDGSGASRDLLEILLPRDAGGTLPIEIGKRLFMFLLKSEDNPDMSTSLAALGLGSLLGVEMRSWWYTGHGNS